MACSLCALCTIWLCAALRSVEQPVSGAPARPPTKALPRMLQWLGQPPGKAPRYACVQRIRITQVSRKPKEK